ncbi:MAG: hypothetical protein P8130_01185 [Deltaproteobacteria bacterium]
MEELQTMSKAGIQSNSWTMPEEPKLEAHREGNNFPIIEDKRKVGGRSSILKLSVCVCIHSGTESWQRAIAAFTIAL